VALDEVTETVTARRASWVVDLRYRWPARYVVSWGALVLAALVAAVLEPGAYRGASLVLVTALAGTLLVASIGQLLVVMLGAIDLSVPAIMTLSAAINVHYLDSLGPAKAFVLALVVCVLVSSFSGAMVSLLRLNSLIVTLAVNTLVTGALIAWMGLSFSATGASPDWLQTIAKKQFGNINAIFIVGVAIAVLVGAVLYRTRPGRTLMFVGANRRASELLGIRANVVAVAAFASAGALYALAGALIAGFVETPDPTLGVTYQLTTLTAVAIAGAAFTGGPASVASLVAACLLLEFIDQALALHQLSSGMRVLVQGVLLVLAVAASSIAMLVRAGWRRATGPSHESASAQQAPDPH
jgi:ribose transport system permease protein